MMRALVATLLVAATHATSLRNTVQLELLSSAQSEHKSCMDNDEELHKLLGPQSTCSQVGEACTWDKVSEACCQTCTGSGAAGPEDPADPEDPAYPEDPAGPGGEEGSDDKPVVVLVHGLFGFGADELGPAKYWTHDETLRQNGLTVLEASVGPLSSNWDRACELYAQIMGTRVDYGEAHSRKYSHERFGKDYTGKGMYPQWSAERPIHLIGHSMGGQTIRMLEALMHEGDADEKAAGGDVSELFRGQDGNWIKSLTTMSSPLEGSTLLDIMGPNGIVNLVKTVILAIATATDDTILESHLYDFDTEHLGLGRREGEDLWDYVLRFFAADIWHEDYKDLAPYDLSPAGSRELQQRGKQTYEGTYYYSYANTRTYSYYTCSGWTWTCGWQYTASNFMKPLLWFFADTMGGLDQDEAWRENDGLVPLISAKCPWSQYSGHSVRAACHDVTGYGDSFDWTPGTWFYEVVSRDHMQMTGGLGLFKPPSLLESTIGVTEHYVNHAKRILAIHRP